MTDETINHGADAAKPEADESFWDEPASGSKRGEWLAQLQTMIEQVATQAGPVMREVGAKAAELAAVAGEKAGPVAHRAAELTSEAGVKLAERSRTFAAEIRRDQASRGEGPAGSNGGVASDGASDSHGAADDGAATDEPTTSGVG